MKNYLAALLLFVTTLAHAGAPVLWGPNDQSIFLQSSGFRLGVPSTSASVLTGSVDPTSVATAGAEGSIYLSSNGNLYIKHDSGTTTNWAPLSTGTSAGGSSGQIQYNSGGGFAGFGNWDGSKITTTGLNLSGLTASQAVVTDSSKNLSSLAYLATGGSSNLVSRDSNGNTAANNVTEGLTSTVSSSGTTTLTAASTRIQVLTGFQGHNYKLPDATTLTVGRKFEFNSTTTPGASVVNIKNNASTNIAQLYQGSSMEVELLNNSTANGTWSARNLMPVNNQYGFNSQWSTFPSIGIGTAPGTQPGAGLEVIGSTRLWFPLLLSNNSMSTPPLILDTNVSDPTADYMSMFRPDQLPISLGFNFGSRSVYNTPHIRIKGSYDGDTGGNLFFQTYNGSSEVTNLAVNSTGRVGIQTESPGAVLDIQNTHSVGAPAPNTPTVSLVPVPSIDPPSGLSAVQIQGQQNPPSSPSATQDGGGTGFIADGSTYTYHFYAYYDSSSRTFGVPFTTASFTDDNSATAFSVSLNWSAPSFGPSNTFYICRSINSGPFSCEDVGHTFSWNDDNTGFGLSEPSVFYDDYVANGTTRNYNGRSVFLSPTGTTYYGPSSPYSMTDDNSGNAYQVQHNAFAPTGSTATKIIGAVDGSSNNASFSIDPGTSIAVEGPSVWTGNNVDTPNQYGILADGSGALTIDFSFYTRLNVGPSVVYTASPTTQSTVDPNDSNYYTIQITGMGSTGTYDNMKIINHNLGFATTTADVVSSAVTDLTIDAFGPSFSDSTDVTPNSLYYPSLLYHNVQNANGTAGQICVGDLDYCRMEYLDHTNALLAKVEADSTGYIVSNTMQSFSLTNSGFRASNLRVQQSTPGSTDSCAPQSIVADDDYIYVCNNAGTGWKRATLSTY